MEGSGVYEKIPEKNIAVFSDCGDDCFRSADGVGAGARHCYSAY